VIRQPFRLLVTGSRTWHDVAVIEQALAVILGRHPEGVLLVHGACPRGADAIAAAYAARTPATARRHTPPTGTGTGGLPVTGATPR
jgi:YspA, cpYpsA-related SLOG family